jgi:hypothetical protein
MAEQVDVAVELPAVSRLRWWLQAVQRRGAGMTEADLLEHMVFTDDSEAARALAFWQSLPEEVERDEVLTIEAIDDGARAVVQAVDGFRYEFKCWVEPDPPHRMTRGWRTKLAAAEITFREAAAEDGPALLELERSAPMRLGDHAITTERQDWFAQLRLMEDAVTFVAEDGGAVVGVQCCGIRTVVLDGVEQPIGYNFRTRVDASHRKGGVFSSLNNLCGDWLRSRGGTFGFGYILEDNERMLQLVGPQMQWETRAELLSLDCEAVAGPTVGRPVTADDASRVVELLNSAHGDKEFFRPYTAESLFERLGRAPDVYGWGNLVMTDDAVVGIWDCGLRIHRDGPDGERVETEAIVLDYGFAPGCDDQLHALLRSAATALTDRGVTNLGIFTSVGSAGREMLMTLPAELDRCVFLWWKPAEPADVAERGLYVDPVYF